MEKIEVLSAEVIDQIAAGEVVERPAHLVKELVENSIDAGASEVEVSFDCGGKTVTVKDNGSGISKDQLQLALSRHATSKIKKTQDIWQINSFGFRGEALASIASVCRLRLDSQPKGQESCCQISSQYGKLSDVETCGGSLGTTIHIEDLFENVPARLKFLKSDTAESTQIKNVLKALALAHHQVSFRVKSKGKLLFYWPPKENKKDRVEQILDISGMHSGTGECAGIKAYVVVSSPNVTARSSRQIWLFAKDRWVQDRSMQAAVMDAYRSLLMHGEYPYAAVWVDCPSEEIDVNIHPTKSQVKFKNSSDVFRAVSRAVRGILEQAPWVEELLETEASHKTQKNTVGLNKGVHFNKNHSLDKASRAGKSVGVNRVFTGESFARTQFSKKSLESLVVTESEVSNPAQGTEVTASNIAGANSFISNPAQNTEAIASDSAYEVVGAAMGESSKLAGASLGIDNSESAVNAVRVKNSKEEGGKWSNLQILGQAALTYIVAQSESSVIFVDQHAAHERVVFERLMENWKSGKIEVQDYLLPLSIQLPEEQVEALMCEQKTIAKLGLSIEQSGPENIAVSSAPAVLKESSIEKALQIMAQDIVTKGGSYAIEKNIGDVFATMACHSVVRAGQALSSQEMLNLLVQMDEFPMSSFCPHGRPVFVEYPLRKLEKDFGRLV